MQRKLEGCGSSEDLIFGNSKGKSVVTDVFDDVVRNAKEKAEIQTKATPYALRHGGLQRLRKMKVHMSLIGSMAGHRKKQTTMQYLKNDNEELRNVIDLMDIARKKKSPGGLDSFPRRPKLVTNSVLKAGFVTYQEVSV